MKDTYANQRAIIRRLAEEGGRGSNPASHGNRWKGSAGQGQSFLANTKPGAMRPKHAKVQGWEGRAAYHQGEKFTHTGTEWKHDRGYSKKYGALKPTSKEAKVRNAKARSIKDVRSRSSRAFK